MELNYGGSDHKPPLTFAPPPPNFSYFPTQPPPGDLGWGFNGSYHMEGPNSAIEMSRFIWREREKEKIREEIMMESAWTQIQKERIREEVIVDEIVRRRLLEADVRRELSIQRDVALRGGGEFAIGQSGVSAPLSTWEVGEAPLGQCFTTYHDRSLGMPSVSSVLRGESGGLITGMQMGVAEPHILEGKQQLGIGKQKDFIVLPRKPPQDVNVCARTSAYSEKGQLREEWSCALCQVTAACEQDLNVHLQGNRHKAKEAGLRKGKNYKIGLFTDSTPSVSSKDVPSMGSKLWKKRDQNISKSAELLLPSQDPNNAKGKDYSFDECGNHNGVSVWKTKNSTGNKNSAGKLLYEANHAGLETLKEKEEPSAGTNLAQVQEGNQQNTQVMQVIQELNVSKKDSKDGVQLEGEENLAGETDLKVPEKRFNPLKFILKFISQQFNNLTVDGKDGCDGEEIASGNSGNSSAVVRKVELEGQKEKVADIDSEISSVNPGQNGDPLISQQFTDSVSNSGTPIARKLENKKKLLRFWCDMCQIGTDTEKVMEIHRTGKKHLSQLLNSNQNTQVMQVDMKLTVTGKDGNDDKKSSSDDLSASAHKVELEGQQQKENNIDSEISSLSPAKSCDPIIVLSQQSGKSVRNSGRPIVRTQGNKKNLFRFWCNTCQIGTDTEKVMEIHQTGKKHLALKKQMFGFWCDVCQIGADTEKVMEIHMAGKKHLSQARLPDINQNLRVEPPNFLMHPIPGAEAGSLDPNVCIKKQMFGFWCDVCEIGADTEKKMAIHKAGKKHLSQPRITEINQTVRNRPANVLMQPTTGAEANSLDPNVCIKKNVAPGRRIKKTWGLKKNSSKFWCDSCHVGADSREEIDSHWYGKKHQKVIHSLVGENSTPSVSVMQGR